MYICISSYNNQELEISEKGDFPLEKQITTKQTSSIKEEKKNLDSKKNPPERILNRKNTHEDDSKKPI